MLSLTIFIVCFLMAAPAHGDEYKIQEKINRFNLLARCFGEDFMREFAIKVEKAIQHCYDTPGPVIRRKRSSLGDIMQQVDDFKVAEDIEFSNLTCVLKQMQTVDSDARISQAFFSFENLYGWLKNTPAGSDPAWVHKLVDVSKDCDALSKGWPDHLLYKQPISNNFRRNMIFFNCFYKMEDTLCTQFQMLQWLEYAYGDFTGIPGLPEDKYEAAEVVYKAMYAASTPEARLADDFFWQKHHL